MATVEITNNYNLYKNSINKEKIAILPKASDKKNLEKNEFPIPEDNVKLFISEDGMRQYHQNISSKKNINQKESVKEIPILTDYNYKLSKAANWTTGNGISYSISDLAVKFVKAYGDLYDEIVQGYANGTKETYIADKSSENGYKKLTMEEELQALNDAYKKASETIDGLAENSRQAQKAFEKYYAKLSKINTTNNRSALAKKYQEQKKEEIPVDIGDKMNQLASEWRNSYIKTASKNNSWENILPLIKNMFSINIPS